jgi:hypothetical protein
MQDLALFGYFINILGLGKNNGWLYNNINSISEKKWKLLDFK